MACATGRNYPDPEGPRYAGGRAIAPSEENATALRVVSFNIEYGIRVDSAIAVLTNDAALRNADVILREAPTATHAVVAGGHFSGSTNSSVLAVEVEKFLTGIGSA